MRNSSLWRDTVFEKEVIFHEFDFETSKLEFEVSKSSIWKRTFFCFFHYYLATSTTDWAQIFTVWLFYAFLCWDTISVKTSLWQLPIVASVFKVILNTFEKQKWVTYLFSRPVRIWTFIHERLLMLLFPSNKPKRKTKPDVYIWLPDVQRNQTSWLCVHVLPPNPIRVQSIWYGTLAPIQAPKLTSSIVPKSVLGLVLSNSAAMPKSQATLYPIRAQSAKAIVVSTSSLQTVDHEASGTTVCFTCKRPSVGLLPPVRRNSSADIEPVDVHLLLFDYIKHKWTLQTFFSDDNPQTSLKCNAVTSHNYDYNFKWFRSCFDCSHNV